MQILTDALHRIAYSTDASAYREMPMGVAYPKTEDDIRELLKEAKRRATCLIPRAAGTSIAGQVVGNGIVMDVSRYMNQILEINAEEKWVRVQPGVVRDELNMALKPYGLFFSPETSTSNRCCIGGMVGNNSCGTHSLIYGSTRHHVIGLRCVLADGSILEVTPSNPLGKGELFDAIMAQLQGWQKDEHIKQLLKENFPDSSIKRRSCGYAIDEALIPPSPLGKGDVDLCKLICGSEGTLCIVTEITLSLDPLPPTHKMVVCQMLNQMDDAWEANLKALQTNPVAVELIDGKILQLAKNNIQAQKNMAVLNLNPDHLPAAILVSEYWGTPPDPLGKGEVVLYDQDVQKVWDLRKAGLGVLTSVEGDAKPVGVIEDTAVAPERLGAYMHDFEQMMQRLGLDCVYYGHISTGELHLRPILNLKLEKDRKLFREVATETAKLVKKHRGSLSGEHGDGRLRGEFIPLLYGQEIYDLFCQLKATWDPDNLLNMGKIVNTPPMDEFLRVDNRFTDSPTPRFPNLLQRIERCNGAGDCRKSNLIGGTMCPAYKVSGEEIATTRARANVLREELTTDPKGVTSKEVKTVLDSCLACKGCKSECPSNVDMTRLRSEILQLCYDATHTPFRSWMVARMAAVERLGSLVPDIYNWFATTQWTSTIIKKIIRFSTKRNIPTLSRHSMRWLIAHDSPIHRFTDSPSKGKIYLFADEFTNYQEAELGLKFAQLVRALGYEVEVPKHVESGRAAISKGCLKLAAKFAKKNVELLSPLITDETPLVGIEPSCILSFRDEYPWLVEKAKSLKANCLLYDEWIMREVARGNISAEDFNHQSSIINHQLKIYLHGHCHQKALIGVEKTAECLRLTGADVHVIPSGCCGLAGSFGYEKEHYETSMKIGEMVLFPTIRQLTDSPIHQFTDSPIIIAAPGTSCRQQILDGTGVKAYHPIEILYNVLYGNISTCAEHATIANS